MNQVLVEQLVMRVDPAGRMAVQTTVSPLPPMVDPVQFAHATQPGAITHSTSWRWTPDGVILTFAHVLPDLPDRGPADDDLTAQRYTALGLEALPVCCHAVRHLHFLVRTDAAVAAIGGYERFWAFAAAVADHHYPAVAGLLPDAPEYQI